MAVKSKQYLFDGAEVKSVSPWDVDSMNGWTVLNAPQDPQGVDLLAQRVPWLYRAIKDRANNVGNMPWSIERNDTEVSNSAEWAEDKPRELEFISNPRKLFAQIEKSLCVAGKAYLALEVNRGGYIKNIKYLSPTTIEEVYDKSDGHITGYKRSINGKTFDCSLASEPAVPGQVQIVAIYDPDYATEIGPGTSSDALAALTAAGVLYSYDTFVAGFFQRGAIKASVLTVESASPGEQERLQHWWDDVVGGVKNAWSAIVMRGKMNSPVVIGEGLDGVENNELTTSRRQDIAVAMGIPESLMISDAANLATRKEDEAHYYRVTIIPDFDLICEAMNEQVFTAIHHLDGYRIQNSAESLDIFQEDEVARTASYNLWMDALLKAPSYDLAIEAMGMYGFEFTEALTAAIKEYFDDKDKEPEPVPPPVVVAPPVEEPETEDEVEDEPSAVPARDIEPATRAMLKNWKRKAIHALKLTGNADIQWITDLLPASQVEEISLSVAACETKAQIEGVFANVEIEAPDPVIVAETVDPLTDELKRATDLLERLMATPAPVEVKAIEPPIRQYMTFNLPAQPEIKFEIPATVVNVPEQPAPIVNVTTPEVTVNVEPTPITIDNNVTVPPSQSAKVLRDASGKITGLEAN